MKQYIAPEIEKIEYEVADCLEGSQNVPIDSEDIGAIINELM